MLRLPKRVRERRRDPVRATFAAGPVRNRSLESSAGSDSAGERERSLRLPLPLNARQPEEHHAYRGYRSQAGR